MRCFLSTVVCSTVGQLLLCVRRLRAVVAAVDDVDAVVLFAVKQLVPLSKRPMRRRWFGLLLFVLSSCPGVEGVYCAVNVTLRAHRAHAPVVMRITLAEMQPV